MTEAEVIETEEYIEKQPDAPDTESDIEESASVEDEKEPEAEYTLEDDLDELEAEYPELISSIKNTDRERYGELRALGLSPKEAYLATGEQRKPHDTRYHLGDSAPRAARSPVSKMTRRELELARSVFDGMSDDEIRRLYNRVKS